MNRTDTPKPRRNYRIRSARTWTLIRERYLAGESARRLGEVFDVTEAAIRARIWRQGWSKRSLAEATPVEAADAGLAEVIAGQLDGDLTPREAARLALNEAVTLLRGGRMGLAGEAARVADVMGRAAARLGDEGPTEAEAPDEAAFEAVRRKVLGLTSPSAEADGEDRSARERRPGGGDAGGGASGGPTAGTGSPPPDRCAVCPPHSPDANGEVNL